MRTSDFDYALPDSLVARYPAPRRDDSRLMVVDRATGRIEHRRFTDLPGVLSGDEVVVVNDTRVLRARVHGHRTDSGGKVELLFVRPDGTADGWVALGRASRPLREGAAITLPGGAHAIVRARALDGSVVVGLSGVGPSVPEWLEAHGHLPLPPYLRRDEEPSDRDRYQTLFASEAGAVAAPTAGLHFTPEVLAALADKGCSVHTLTLHVGPGTFRPVSTDDPRDHLLDPEAYCVPQPTADAIADARQDGRPVLAVGTTVVRALEHSGGRAGHGLADTLLLPGDPLQVVDRLLTNFHLPKSSLLMLVAAFAGVRTTLSAYREAVGEGYRFYSYGDATLWL